MGAAWDITVLCKDNLMRLQGGPLPCLHGQLGPCQIATCQMLSWQPGCQASSFWREQRIGLISHASGVPGLLIPGDIASSHEMAGSR